MVKNACIVLSVFLVLMSGAFWGAQSFLSGLSRDNVDGTTFVNKSLKESALGVDLEERLQAISRIDGEFVFWSDFLADIAENTNDRIAFTSLELDKDKRVIKIKGKAEHRNALLDFKQKMESSKRFSRIIFPVENILKKENVSFNIKAELDPEEYQ